MKNMKIAASVLILLSVLTMAAEKVLAQNGQKAVWGTTVPVNKSSASKAAPIAPKAQAVPQKASAPAPQKNTVQVPDPEKVSAPPMMNSMPEYGYAPSGCAPACDVSCGYSNCGEIDCCRPCLGSGLASVFHFTMNVIATPFIAVENAFANCGGCYAACEPVCAPSCAVPACEPVCAPSRAIPACEPVCGNICEIPCGGCRTHIPFFGGDRKYFQPSFGSCAPCGARPAYSCGQRGCGSCCGGSVVPGCGSSCAPNCGVSCMTGSIPIISCNGGMIAPGK